MSLEQLKLRYRVLRGLLWAGAVLICTAAVIKINVISDLTSFITAIILALAAFVVLLLIGYRILWQREKQAFRRSKLCYRCGYDVRASSERCPECGEAIGAE